jgi:hypothetical protein
LTGRRFGFQAVLAHKYVARTTLSILPILHLDPC